MNDTEYKEIPSETIEDLGQFIKLNIETLRSQARDIDEENDYEVSALELTFATDDNGEFWGFQSGDNSFTGAAYHYPHWAVVYLMDDNRADHFHIDEILQDVIEQWGELIN